MRWPWARRVVPAIPAAALAPVVRVDHAHLCPTCERHWNCPSVGCHAVRVKPGMGGWCDDCLIAVALSSAPPSSR